MITRFKLEAELRVNGFIDLVPPDQWIREFYDWYSICWGAYQVAITDYAIGPSVRNSLIQDQIVPPKGEVAKKLCGMQKMRKQGGFM